MVRTLCAVAKLRLTCKPPCSGYITHFLVNPIHFLPQKPPVSSQIQLFVFWGTGIWMRRDMEASEAISMSTLLCGEPGFCLNDCVGGDDDDDNECIRFSWRDVDFSESENEYIALMIEKECTFIESQASVVNDNENWLKCARLDAIKWTKNRKEYFGFGLETAYLSVTYMDRFLSGRAIDKEHGWAMQLLSVACLSLAAKMEECRIPPLSEVQGEDYRFTNDVIQRMELLVLNALEWRLFPVTPFRYLTYFVTKFNDKSNHEASLSRAIELILGILEVMNSTDYRPSAIAAAAVLAASGRKLSKISLESKIRLATACLIDTESVFSCYNLMQGLDIDTWRTPKFVISPDLSSVYRSPGGKRKKLSSDDYSYGSCISDEKRPD